MNKIFSGLALLFFSIVWVIGLVGGEVKIDHSLYLMNVGFMWLSLAAVVGGKK